MQLHISALGQCHEEEKALHSPKIVLWDLLSWEDHLAFHHNGLGTVMFFVPDTLTSQKSEELIFNLTTLALSLNVFWESNWVILSHFMVFALCSCTCPFFSGILFNLFLQLSKFSGNYLFILCNCKMWSFSETIPQALV